MTKDTKKSSGRARSIRERLGEDAYLHYRATGEYDVDALGTERITRQRKKQAGSLEPSEREKTLLANQVKKSGKTVEEIAAANGPCARIAAWTLTS